MHQQALGPEQQPQCTKSQNKKQTVTN